MIVIKRFARDNALDDCLDQLVEVLVQLLEEKTDQGETSDLRSGGTRVIHVVGDDSIDDGFGA